MITLISCNHDEIFDDANGFDFRLVDDNGKDLIIDDKVTIDEIAMKTKSGDPLRLVRKYSEDSYLTTVPVIQQPDYVIICKGRSTAVKINFSYDYLNKKSPPSWTIGSVWSSRGVVTVEYNHPDHFVYVIPI